jgi:hypothetical protein
LRDFGQNGPVERDLGDGVCEFVESVRCSVRVARGRGSAVYCTVDAGSVRGFFY